MRRGLGFLGVLLVLVAGVLAMRELTGRQEEPESQPATGPVAPGAPELEAGDGGPEERSPGTIWIDAPAELEVGQSYLVSVQVQRGDAPIHRVIHGIRYDAEVLHLDIVAAGAGKSSWGLQRRPGALRFGVTRVKRFDGADVVTLATLVLSVRSAPPSGFTEIELLRHSGRIPGGPARRGTWEQSENPPDEGVPAPFILVNRRMPGTADRWSVELLPARFVPARLRIVDAEGE